LNNWPFISNTRSVFNNKNAIRRLDMALEKFVNPKESNTPTISIRRNGSISFNIIARKQFQINKSRFVSLYYDKENSEIGIRPTNDKNEPGIININQKRGKTPSIYCKPFLNRCGILYRDEPAILSAQWDSEQEMIIVRLP
jgi:hypothetical protein